MEVINPLIMSLSDLHWNFEDVHLLCILLLGKTFTYTIKAQWKMFYIPPLFFTNFLNKYWYNQKPEMILCLHYNLMSQVKFLLKPL